MNSLARPLNIQMQIPQLSSLTPVSAPQQRHFGFWSEFKAKFKEGLEEDKDLEESIKRIKESKEAASEKAKAVAESKTVERLSKTAADVGDTIAAGADKVGGATSKVTGAVSSGVGKVASAVSESGPVRAAVKGTQAVKRGIDSTINVVSSTPVGRAAKFVSEEVDNLQEVVDEHWLKGRSREIDSERVYELQPFEDIEDLEEQMVARLELHKANVLAEKLLREQVLREMEGESAEDIAKKLRDVEDVDDEVVEEEEIPENPAGTDALMNVEQKQTVWAKRLSSLRDGITRWEAYRKVQEARIAAHRSSNPIVTKTREMKQQYREEYESLREDIDNSQHPMIWRMRDAQDTVMGETETGFALGLLREIDPKFRQDAFMKYMENYYVPRVVEAWLKADMRVLRTCMEEQAIRLASASFKERETLKHFWDSRILDISHLEFQNALVVDETPMVYVTFMAQQLNCTRNMEGEIVDGSEYDIKTVFYAWMMRRDPTDEEFGWKITEMAQQKLSYLV